MIDLEAKSKINEPTLEDLIKNQNIKPIANMNDFYKQWATNIDSDKLYDFIMQERKERRGKK